MYTQRKNHRQVPATFNGLLDNFLTNDWGKFFHDDSNWANITAPVNIKETEATYEMELVAPGLKKEDFNINVEKDVLTVSFEQSEENNESTDKYIRREYNSRSFKRNFTLSNKINVDDISAKYEDGVLRINLPKAEKELKSTKKIDIA